MRELAKSMVGFSMSVGLFGLQQLGRAITPDAAPPETTAAQLDDVAHTAQRYLSDQYAEQFRAVDEWQRRVIDMIFDATSMRSFDPRAIASSMDPRPLMNDIDPRKVFQGSVDLLQRGVDALRPAAAPAQTPSVE